MRKFFLFFLLLLSGLCIAPSAFAQESVQVKPNINYTANRPRYILAGLTIDGIKGFDDNLLLSVSGLTVGETYEVPGPEISEAIMRYWQQKLFSNVSIEADSIVGGKIYLHIKLTAQPRISSINYNGVKKSEREELEKKIEPDYEVGEEVSEPVDFAKFGRRAILTLRQTLASKILELEHDALFNKYKDRVGQIISAEVYQVWKREVLLVDDENNELILPKSEQIPTDQYRKGETVRAVIERVDNENNNPKIILSRTSGKFLEHLLEQEVPEIADGLIAIKAVARIPGERAKVAVESFDDRVDPVGACVGVRGSRVHGIVRELCNENIDVINWTANTKLFIQRALNPAKVSSIDLNEEDKKAEVFLDPSEVSLAIGRGGQNIKLASMLTGYTIDVYRVVDGKQEAEVDDVYLDQFNDEIDQWIIAARDWHSRSSRKFLSENNCTKDSIFPLLRPAGPPRSSRPAGRP